MSGGLRERKRLAAMRHIRETALDLFDERGFAEVTIEQIAQAAEVSPSTVYRHFGTKEGLVVVDELDVLGWDALAGVFDVHDPVGAMVGVVAAYETQDGAGGAAAGVQDPGAGPWRRVRYFFQEPSVRSAVHASLGRVAARLAEALRTGRGMSVVESRVVAAALVFGYFAALEQWHVDGGVRPIRSYVEEGLSALRGV